MWIGREGAVQCRRQTVGQATRVDRGTRMDRDVPNENADTAFRREDRVHCGCPKLMDGMGWSCFCNSSASSAAMRLESIRPPSSAARKADPRATFRMLPPLSGNAASACQL